MSDTAAGTYEIRWAEDKDWIPAMHMIWKTFLKFEAWWIIQRRESVTFMILLRMNTSISRSSREDIR